MGFISLSSVVPHVVFHKTTQVYVICPFSVHGSYIACSMCVCVCVCLRVVRPNKLTSLFHNIAYWDFRLLQQSLEIYTGSTSKHYDWLLNWKISFMIIIHWNICPLFVKGLWGTINMGKC